MDVAGLLECLVAAVRDDGFAPDARLASLRWAPSLDPDGSPGWDPLPIIGVTIHEAGAHVVLVVGAATEQATSLAATIEALRALSLDCAALEVRVRDSSQVGRWDVHVDEAIASTARNRVAGSFGVIPWFDGVDGVLGAAPA